MPWMRTGEGSYALAGQEFTYYLMRKKLMEWELTVAIYGESLQMLTLGLYETPEDGMDAADADRALRPFAPAKYNPRRPGSRRKPKWKRVRGASSGGLTRMKGRHRPATREAEVEAINKRIAPYKRVLVQILEDKMSRSPRRRRALPNPSKDPRMPVMRGWPKDVYDPRRESIRAIDRATGGFGIARYEGGIVGRWTPAEIIQRSWERYQDPDKVIRDRQEYELMLGENRASGPYRITHEPTRAGLRYFVWPLSKGQRVPVGWESPHAADYRIQQLYNHESRPAKTLPPKRYTKAELTDWLPPDRVFAGRMGSPSRAAITKAKAARRAATACAVPPKGALADRYRQYDPDWGYNQALCQRYMRGEEPPKR